MLTAGRMTVGSTAGSLAKEGEKHTIFFLAFLWFYTTPLQQKEICIVHPPSPSALFGYGMFETFLSCRGNWCKIFRLITNSAQVSVSKEGGLLNLQMQTHHSYYQRMSGIVKENELEVDLSETFKTLLKYGRYMKKVFSEGLTWPCTYSEYFITALTMLFKCYYLLWQWHVLCIAIAITG